MNNRAKARSAVAFLVLPWLGFLLDTWLGAALGGVMYIATEDLHDEVEGIINAADFIDKTDGAQLLFI